MTTFCAEPHPLDPSVLCGQPEGHLLQRLPHVPAGVADQDVEPWGLVPFHYVLTNRQRQILKFITAYVEAQGYPPSVQEIGDEVGLDSKSSVHHHLKALERKGYLRRAAGRARAMSVTVPNGEVA